LLAVWGGCELVAEGGEGFLDVAFVGFEAVDDGDELGDEVGAAFELDFEERPALTDAVSGVDETVVDEDGPAEEPEGGEGGGGDEGGDEALVAGVVEQGGPSGETGGEEPADSPAGAGPAVAVEDLFFGFGGEEVEWCFGGGVDFWGDDVGAFAGFADDEELGVEGDPGFHERAGHGGVGDGSTWASVEVEGVGGAAGQLDELERPDFRAVWVDEDDAGVIAEVEGSGFAAAGDGDDAGFDAGAGLAAAVLVGVGFLDDAAPVFIDAP